MHTYMISFEAIEYADMADIYDIEYITFPLNRGHRKAVIVDNPNMENYWLCFVNERDKNRASKVFRRLLNEKYREWHIFKGA